MIWRRIGPILSLCFCFPAFAGTARKDAGWTVLHDCRLIANAGNDGDSVHVAAGDKEYIFRLYLVDAPETGVTDPSRLLEQAKYFGVTTPQVIDVGEQAKEFTAAKLADPFTVLTRLSNAMGRSRTERYYAFVETKDGDLGEQLVRNGLARIHGTKIIAPGLSSSREEEEHLQQLEAAAKEEKIGGWGSNVGRLKQRADKPAPHYTVFRLPEAAAVSAKLDINQASERELESIPGVGPVMAASIIAARPFQSADELKRVPGIGEKKYEQMRPHFQ